MRYEKRAEVLAYKGQERTIRTLGWWCTKCGEGILSGASLKARQQAFLTFKAGLDDVMSPDEIAAVREKLGLSQRKAGELLGGGPRAFQKYEAGAQAVSTPMSNLLRLLARDPSRLQELRVSRRPVGTAKTKRTRQGSNTRQKSAAG
jgi:HTH-type transcriptional regulator/antitoxin MqsA